MHDKDERQSISWKQIDAVTSVGVAIEYARKHRDANQWSSDAHWLSVRYLNNELNSSWPLLL
jgi:hypothetical protein